MATVLDLFCGCGGLSLGFQEAGFDIVGAHDHWCAAVSTYNRNFSHHATKTEISPQAGFCKADVIIGGPPCQGFSSAGLRLANDHRNTLVSAFAQIIAQLLPKAFVFENVEGFLTGARGAYVFELLEPLVAAGYRIHLRKINAANFGVPQHRKRVVAIGGLGWDPEFLSPSHMAFGAPGASTVTKHKLPFTPTLKQALRGLPKAFDDQRDTCSDHIISQLSEDDLERVVLLEQGQCMRDLPETLWHESYRRRAYRRVMDGTPTERRGGPPAGLRRLKEDEPSKAITGGALGEFVHPRENRPLTIRECARLQTFPDTFVFLGSQRDKIQMIGNAVPPVLAKIIAQQLIQQLPVRLPRKKEGRLLTFFPTHSNGMSPLLQEVCNKVSGRFLTNTKSEQLALCL